MLFEIKHAAGDETLTHALKEAAEQVRSRRYDETLVKEGYRTVISYGIAFKGKDCMIEQSGDAKNV